MSEKRGMGTSNDPNHIRLFQDIKHQRQTSGKFFTHPNSHQLSLSRFLLQPLLLPLPHEPLSVSLEVPPSEQLLVFEVNLSIPVHLFKRRRSNHPLMVFPLPFSFKRDFRIGSEKITQYGEHQSIYGCSI